MMIAVQKLALKSAQDSRKLIASSWQFYLLPPETEAATTTKEVLAAYAERVKGNKDHKEGPPHVHAFMQFFLKAAEHPDLNERAKAITLAVLAVLGAEGIEAAATFMPVFTLKPARKHQDRQPSWKLSFSLSPMAPSPLSPEKIEQHQAALAELTGAIGPTTMPEIQMYFKMVCEQLGGKAGLGAAPPPEVERQVQRHLAELLQK